MAESAELKGYAGRNKHGRKTRTLDQSHSPPQSWCSPAVQMKIKELYRRRFPTKMVSPLDLALPTCSLPTGLTQLGSTATAPPLPCCLVSLLGPSMSWACLTCPRRCTQCHPDVKLQRLPFYDMLDELIKPTSLSSDNSQRFQETCYAFALTPQQVQQISSSMDISGTKCDFAVQVQLRRPINITSLVRLSTTVPNTIVVSWTSEIGRSFSMAVYLVRQQTSTVLLQRLRAKGIRNPDHSRALIKEKLTADPESEIATTSLRVSLLCPLGKMRLTIPCRALTCSHLQCFDATLYIQMNEKKPTWVCPVCDKKAPYEHLIIDGLFMEILNSCSDCDEIQFTEDGIWSPMRSKKEVQEVSGSYNGVDSDSGRTDVSEHKHGSSHDYKKVDVIDLTLDSSSEDELDDEPPPKRSCPSLSPSSPPATKGVLNLHSQASPVSRAPSMPAVETSYIPPPPPLIQDYRHYYHTPSDLPDLNFFSFLQGDNQHYNMMMAAAAAAASASTSEDHDLLLNRFLPYGSSQMFLDQPSTPGSGTLAATNGGSNSGSTSSLVSSGSLRERDKDRERDRDRDRDSHSISGMSRSSAEAAAAVMYGSISDVISLD
ncbi:hypothetical protein CRUP_038593 [Coryphaenoides rupestris]|nr:hypothetical protein CRUP_038593 [Coryphaenoides rupestris]